MPLCDQCGCEIRGDEGATSCGRCGTPITAAAAITTLGFAPTATRAASADPGRAAPPPAGADRPRAQQVLQLTDGPVDDAARTIGPTSRPLCGLETIIDADAAAERMAPTIIDAQGAVSPLPPTVIVANQTAGERQPDEVVAANLQMNLVHQLQVMGLIGTAGALSDATAPGPDPPAETPEPSPQAGHQRAAAPPAPSRSLAAARGGRLAVGRPASFWILLGLSCALLVTLPLALWMLCRG